MNTVGIIGGMDPESTIEYYRKIVNAYCERDPQGSYPQSLINSINMTKMIDLITHGEFDKATTFLVTEAKRLIDAGADFGILASNTPHIVFDKLRQASSLPFISIVEGTCKKTVNMNLKRVALFGTKFTMQNS